MRPLKKVLTTQAKRFMNPLRRLTVESRPKRSPIAEPKEPQRPKRRVVTGPKPAWVSNPVPVAKPGPRLVQQPNKVQKMAHGDYLAEITVNRTSSPLLFHYVVVKKGSPAILEWGQTISVHAAIATAKKALQRLSAADPAPEQIVAAG